MRAVKNQFILWVIVALFFGPIFGAWALYHTERFITKKTSNHGALIIPPLTMANLAFQQLNDTAVENKQPIWQGKWLLFYFAPNNCDTLCWKNLYKIRQVKTALNADSSRIERLLIIPTHNNLVLLKRIIAHDYLGTQLAYCDTKIFANFIQSQATKSIALSKGYLYLSDPLGNVMMSYSPELDGKELLADLQHLLKVSQIG